MRFFFRFQKVALGASVLLSMVNCSQPGKYGVARETEAGRPDLTVTANNGGGSESLSTPSTGSDASLALPTTSVASSETQGGPSSSFSPVITRSTEGTSSSTESDAASESFPSCSEEPLAVNCAEALDCGWASSADDAGVCLPGGRFRQVGTQDGDEGRSLAFGENGSIWLAGHTSGKFPGQPSDGSDMFIRGWDRQGMPLWTRQIAEGSNLYYWAMVITTGGKFVLAAVQDGVEHDQVVVDAMDQSGQSAWTVGVAGDSTVEAEALAAAPSGGIYITEFRVTGQMDDAGIRPGTQFVEHYDESGKLVWSTEVDPILDDGHVISAWGMAIATWPDGSFLVTGTSYYDLGLFPFGGNMTLTKISPEGVVLWAKALDIPGEWTNQAAIDPNGNIIVGSQVDYAGVVHKLSPEGEPLWAVELGPITYQFPRVATDTAGNIYVAATTDGGFSDIGYDGFASHLGTMDVAVARLSPEGDVIWKKQFGTPQDEVVAGIAWHEGNAYVYGSTTGAFVEAAGEDDAFVVQVVP